MEEKIKKYSTVSFDAIHQGELNKTCKKLGLTKGEFLEKSINYFSKTGLHPDEYAEDVRTQIKEFRKTFVGFTRERERLVDNKLEELKTLVSNIAPTANRAEVNILDSFNEVISQQATITRGVSEIITHLQTKK